MDFKDKVVIITGGAGGIGVATAKKFLALGARVALVDLNKEHLDKALEEISPEPTPDITGIECDITTELAVSATVQKVLAKWGRLDVVVNNAGLMSFKAIEEQSIEDWQKIFGVDLFGAFFFIKHAFKNMNPGGAIVNVSSIHAIETEPLVAPYAAAKAALLSLTRSAALEGKGKGIRINAVLPGGVDTPMLWDNPNVSAGLERIDRADVGSPADIANTIVFLSSDDASFVQGASLIVDGGRLDRL